METRLDFFGQEINIGDTVIFGTTMGQGRGFEFGVVSKFTPKKIAVNCPAQKWRQGSTTTSCYAEQLCKVDPELVTLKILKGVKS